MTASPLSPTTDVISRRLAVVRSLREQLLDDEGDEPLQLQETIGRNLWLFGADFDARPFEADASIAADGAPFFAGPGLRAVDASTSPRRSAGFYTRSTSNPFLPDHGVIQLVIVLLSRSDVRPGQVERSMVWKCVKHLRSEGLVRAETRVTGFILSHLFERGEHETVQHGSFTVIQPMFFHPMLDKAEHRLINMY